jgi:hypothetical protein
MNRHRTTAMRAATFAMLAGTLAGGLLSCRKGPSSLQGAVLEGNSDPRKEPPITDVAVTASIGSTSSSTKTDSSGHFSIPLRGWIRSGQSIRLQFRHPGYQNLELKDTVSDKLYIVHMAPIPSRVPSGRKRPTTKIANVKVRYSMKTTASINVGSAVQTFEVANTGNVPCKGQRPCSPDGKWKAIIGSITLDAGEGNDFRNARLSCIAGPCPFTKVESDGYSKGGNKISASVLNWSDTTTFLLEAEVYHPIGSEAIQESYPVIFGETLNFSVPNTGEGVSIQAEVNGEPLVFPLGPSLCLSWANCTVAGDKNHSRSYRCELKDGYDFR